MLDKVSKDSPRKIARHAAALRNPSKEPRETPQIKARIVRLLRGGCTLTEICERKEMPCYASICFWRDRDHEFADQVALAMQYQSEYVIKESSDMLRAEAEKPNPDTDRQKVLSAWSEASLKYAAAIAPRKFGALAKLGVDGECTPQLQIVTFASVPMVGASGLEIAGARTNGHDDKAGVQATPDRKAQGSRRDSNGRAGCRDSSGKRGLKVQANRNTTRKAKLTKAGA